MVKRRGPDLEGNKRPGAGSKSHCAIITGVTGQDGYYLAQLLLEKGYLVVGTTRNKRSADEALPAGVELAELSLFDVGAIRELIAATRPSEIYNLAAVTSVAGSFDDPLGVMEINGLAPVRLLEAVRAVDPSIRIAQASSSEMFGDCETSPQTERSCFRPSNPYSAAKLCAHNMIEGYRRRYGLFACSAIFFNHESPRRGLGFVTRKITDGAARIKLGLSDELVLGNLDARRDWGFSGDFMRGMWLMLQANRASDYVFATGRTLSVRDVCRIAFERVGLDYQRHVRGDEGFFRPAGPVELRGDATKARAELDWRPSIEIDQLVRLMVDTDLSRLRAIGRGDHAEITRV